ncbi:MAG TPA: class I SAM-dependent rRNA methyltransferase [Planctomycetaceae bacterium]|nr:class I SAM-dependent rRNA methyltransferase [Planctomycetaceae bacterium]
MNSRKSMTPQPPFERGMGAKAVASCAALTCDGTRELPEAILKRRTSHPLVYRNRIQQLVGKPRLGDWVRVSHLETESGQPEHFAYALYNPKSEIALRILRWSDQPPDQTFWDGLLDRAVSLRTETLRLDDTTDCYRVLHAEADGFPGLAVDRYGRILSAEVFSLAMAPRVQEIVERLGQRLGTQHWLISPSPHCLSQEGYELASRHSSQMPYEVIVTENQTRYKVHFGTGHKTGFFCDQRDNRLRLSELCNGRSVLDLCCYTGGFSVMAASRGQASEVIGVDLDEAPLQVARQNAALNQAKIKFTQADAFAYMRDMLRMGRQFDIVVLDPPKLIRNRAEMEEGTRKHFDLNRLAMQLVVPGGLMLTCSCAGLLPDAEFTRLVRSAARTAFLPSTLNPHPTPRNMQILAKAGAAACHPVSANCPESEYFKSLWLRL